MSMERVMPASLESGVPANLAEPSATAPRLLDHAEDAAGLMKALSHSGRLMILCHLADGEKSVTELEVLLGQRQAAVSQQLARLRLEGLVATRRDGKAIHYALRDARALAVLRTLAGLFA